MDYGLGQVMMSVRACRVFSYAAICANTGKLVGFVTARIVYMHECDPLVGRAHWNDWIHCASHHVIHLAMCGCYVLLCILSVARVAFYVRRWHTKLQIQHTLVEEVPHHMLVDMCDTAYVG